MRVSRFILFVLVYLLALGAVTSLAASILPEDPYFYQPPQEPDFIIEDQRKGNYKLCKMWYYSPDSHKVFRICWKGERYVGTNKQEV